MTASLHTDPGKPAMADAEDRAAATAHVAEMRKALEPERVALIEARRGRERQRDRNRKRESRAQQTPEKAAKEAARQRKARSGRPFLAIDGEGGGKDALGRQPYLLMVAAGLSSEEEFVLHRDGQALSTVDCLEFILKLPKNRIIVAFGLGYDATQILRGIRRDKLKRIFNPPPGKNGPFYTYWGDYAIIYQQGQYLQVARIDRSGPRPKPLEGSCRIINEVLGFFQSTFVKAIENWNNGNEEERAIIKANKGLRNEFTELTEEMVNYCKLECHYLTMLMTEFRETCHAVRIYPERWRGAGWLAAAMFKLHGAPKRPLTAREREEAAAKEPPKKPRTQPAIRRPDRDREFDIAANLAYYGGRFEVSRIGNIPGPLYEYDLKSAYPAAMLQIPCPVHTRWVHSRKKRVPEAGELYLAKVTFKHPRDSLWCGFPFRQKGGLFWPLCGTGWYWSVEIEAACRHLKAEIIKIHDVWIAERYCDCRPYDWINEVYAERQRLGGSTKGYPLKLGLNSLYGKRAQRSGRGPYHDVVEAGLITAITRAAILEGLGQDPDAVVMIATDAVFSTRPLMLDGGDGLGQWEKIPWPDLFIAQPGVYFSSTKLKNNGSGKSFELGDGIKSRGVKRSVIGEAAPRFLDTWSDWFKLARQPEALKLLLEEQQMPSVPVTVHIFYGCRLALVRGKPWLAGTWSDETRQETFEWETKRDPKRVIVNGEGSLTTFPRTGSPFAESEGYKPADFDKHIITVLNDRGELEEIGEDVWLEGMPDHIDFLPHEE